MAPGNYLDPRKGDARFKVGDIVDVQPLNKAESPGSLTQKLAGDNRVFVRLGDDIKPGYKGKLMITSQNKDKPWIYNAVPYTGIAAPKAVPPSGYVEKAQVPPPLQMPKEIYLLHLGPTTRADDSAIAICNEASVRGMKDWDAVVYLITRHDDKSIFPESTDRRIAAGLFSVYENALRENALDELIITLGNQPVKRDSKKTLGEYFVKQADKYQASATLKKGPEAKAQPVVEPSAPVIHRVQSTVAKKGAPGLEMLL